MSNKDMNIGGIKLTISIEFNSNDTRKYEDISEELVDRIENVIESLGHKFKVGFSKPILNTDIKR